jgi:hypothetical protein
MVPRPSTLCPRSGRKGKKGAMEKEMPAPRRQPSAPPAPPAPVVPLFFLQLMPSGMSSFLSLGGQFSQHRPGVPASLFDIATSYLYTMQISDARRAGLAYLHQMQDDARLYSQHFEQQRRLQRPPPRWRVPVQPPCRRRTGDAPKRRVCIIGIHLLDMPSF